MLIAGKGHEEYQVYKNKIINISDKKIVKKIKINPKILNIKKKNFFQNSLVLKNTLGKKNFQNFHGVSIDSRTIKKYNLFLALRGKIYDGSKFIMHALKKGAGCVVSPSNHKINNKKIIKIKDTISFLNKFAKNKREITSAKIVAITGSAGKTSLKNLIKNLLQNFGKPIFHQGLSTII